MWYFEFTLIFYETEDLEHHLEEQREGHDDAAARRRDSGARGGAHALQGPPSEAGDAGPL